MQIERNDSQRRGDQLRSITIVSLMLQFFKKIVGNNRVCKFLSFDGQNFIFCKIQSFLSQKLKNVLSSRIIVTYGPI